MAKVATIAAQLNFYDKAIEKFEFIGQVSLENNLTKYSARDYLFKAGLCIMAQGDLIGARRGIEKYNSMDGSFSGTRECTLLNVRKRVR